MGYLKHTVGHVFQWQRLLDPLQSFFLILLGTQLGYVFYPFCTLLGSNDWVLDSGTWGKSEKCRLLGLAIKSRRRASVPFPSWLWLGWWPQANLKMGGWESHCQTGSQRTVTWVRASFSTATIADRLPCIIMCVRNQLHVLVNCNLFGSFVNNSLPLTCASGSVTSKYTHRLCICHYVQYVIHTLFWYWYHMHAFHLVIHPLFVLPHIFIRPRYALTESAFRLHLHWLTKS